MTEYKYGFESNIDTYVLEKGLSENTIKQISNIRNEPSWLLEFRLKAYKQWVDMPFPSWQIFPHPKIDFQNISYFASPQKTKYESLDEIDPEILRAYEKLGIPLDEQKRISGVAIDAVLDSVSIVTTFKEELSKLGIIFCNFSEAVQKYPELVQKYLSSVVPINDNFYSALNSAVFTDGSFIYIPPNTKCPMPLSTYFRINSRDTGQFERTLIIVDENSSVNYLEGCSAPMRDENQLHAAVVELVALKNSTINYQTVQNWYPGDKNGLGGIYNFVTKRGLCEGYKSKITWTQIETGSAITWKYPSCILKGDESIGEFYSVAISNNHQIADTGTKMIILGNNTKSTIISKGIVSGNAKQIYRGKVFISPKANNARNYTQCDSLIIGNSCAAMTKPYIETKNKSAIIEHEASTSKINEDQLKYLMSRGFDKENSINLIINGFCKEILKNLDFEFAAEAQQLLELSLEGAIG